MLDKDDQPFCDIYGATSSNVLTEYLSPKEIIESSEEELVSFLTDKSRNMHYNMAKNSFRAKCRLYELSYSYKIDLEKQHALYQTADKAKRQGKLPEWFTEDFMAEVEHDPNAMEEVCMRHNIFPISIPEYNRWKIKSNIGRKGLFETSKKFQSPEFMESLRKKENDS